MVFGWGPSKRNSLRIHSHLSKSPLGKTMRAWESSLFRRTTACRWASDERHSVAVFDAIMHYFVKRRK